MAFEGEFSKILRQKMDFSLENDDFQAKPKGHFQRKMGDFMQIFMNPVVWTPHQIPKAYPRKRAKTVVPPKPQKVEIIKEESWVIKELSDVLLKKIRQMEALGAKWPETISQSSAKSEFRRLAKIYHPDHRHPQCNGKKFQVLLLLYRQIRSELELISKQEQEV